CANALSGGLDYW
nr:immunoglobulin heavy chain junction region [Macaca mulatta]MOX63936.1 immunoglobulin heavy chain junction region [Macaca mulatta]MOX64355.1 immunoglobulin heavy chain junction region [Macaca mulatta]MOX66602.1 immunoglobulin heavy chain junction region [Macaca mulatta]MOX68102.1 immunoglobulin heavy chain junction region [Macaca mulatta]